MPSKKPESVSTKPSVSWTSTQPGKRVLVAYTTSEAEPTTRLWRALSVRVNCSENSRTADVHAMDGMRGYGHSINII